MTTYNSKADYYSNEGQPQAVRLFDKLGSREHHGVSLAMTLGELRKRLEQFSDNTPIQAALADLWLDQDQKEARRRRKDKPPQSLFVTVGKSEVAPKGEIPSWDLAWRTAAIKAVRLRSVRLADAWVGITAHPWIPSLPRRGAAAHSAAKDLISGQMSDRRQVAGR